FNVFSVPADMHGSYSLSLRLLSYLDWVNQVDPGLRSSVLVQDIVRDFETWGFPRSLVTSSLSRLVSIGVIECDQWFVDFPEDTSGRRGAYPYDLDYSHRLSLSPRGYFY